MTSDPLVSEPAARSRWPLAAVGAALVLAAIVLGAWIGWVRDQAPFAVDAAWALWISQHRGPVLLWASYAMNQIGGEWFGVIVLPLAITLALFFARRRREALFFIVACIVSAGAVQVLKHVVGRARPEEIIVIADVGSYPSGHVANAATIALALVVLVPRWWAYLLAVAWVLAMAFTRTFLGAHFITDTVGGTLLGVGAGLLIAAWVRPRPLVAPR
ncbi:phosphatase PAP2 family protein [uncultured Microbacterium sp.]|uniref:phosphatase PAP2 family protein n=1 Tax=uncultured Microbacterium sp. TaxID=191216 RepID=UPI0025D50CAC|nr:phosphatase PAP2 family protein [uncultured Microbacterium sp.]